MNTMSVLAWAIAMALLVSSITARNVGPKGRRRRNVEVEDHRRNLQDLLPPSWITVTEKAPIDPRRDACFVMVQGRAYLIGGNGRKVTNIYDPVKREWTEGPAPPVAIHHTQCVVADDKIYMVSAWIGEYDGPIQDAPYIYIYDTLTKQWSTKEGLPAERRRGAAAVVLVGRRIYVSHGIPAPPADGKPRAATTGFLDCYDLDKDAWYTGGLPDAPNPRDHTGGALLRNGLLCVAGGRDSGSNAAFKSVLPTDCYDPVKNVWVVQAPIPQGRANAAYGTTCDGQLLVAGGRGGNDVIDGDRRGKGGGDDVLTGGGGDDNARGGGGMIGGRDDKVFTTVQVFDGTSWSTVNPLVMPRYGSGLAVDCSNEKAGVPAQTCLNGAGVAVPCSLRPGGTGLMTDDCNRQTHVAGGASDAAGNVEVLSVETLFPYGVDVRCFP